MTNQDTYGRRARSALYINEWPKAGWLSVIFSRRYALIRIVELVRHVDRALA